ncbi:FixJ family two-component response regulator [Inquilinus ginsengisoli]|uniref:FixJ family two-component response regulator n=1 Tax=Inquilinus ginsengisoli TaxID=363840 RepID=A0ABU1JT31_9PROT|nr:response regulator transcription factor [Inquilinus ginsengisoli]MDR6290745.1 FixJ family two-component response regulator [Inquilinus ginsengisoli]
MAATPLVFIVDDDEAIREALTDLLRSVGIESRCFGSTRDLLDAAPTDRPGCLILDVRLPGLSGLDLQAQLVRNRNTRPIIFMTGHGDVPMTVRAMKAGAMDFLTKPFRDQDMLDAVAAAIDKDMAQRQEAVAAKEVAAQAATLTPRETEVMAAVVKGLMNKQIAGLLGISEITVKLHRGNVMRKMEVRSVADLVRKAELLAR